MPAPRHETLLHIAERHHWESARDAGVSYTMSTLGRTLDEEGFIHCSSDTAQVEGVLDRFYTGVDRTTLALLVIDTGRLDAPVRYEPAGDELFPHVYGPIPIPAVIEVRPVPETR
ncbi:DUF952 domain-containing protein [Actinomadura rubrisoli]|uniref:DUF952 domain-containing protein n=1 Tax=Actinomadura rubrisoli TaxID=2530368 RepID=A0A4R5C138_9ACTN|nr:DUF952 domain-containing protein [Actinomadura rubrisoli]TDD91733.1 DUF952 domain-containing protein [Actinomadura rubrisoli]